MKKAIGMIIAAVALLSACASAPEPVPRPEDEYETAKSLRTQIQRFELAQYAQSEFDAGEEQFATGETALETEDNATAKAAFDLAIDRYTEVVRAGFRALSQAARGRAEEQQTLAEDVRADVAATELYDEAVDLYNDAVAAEEEGDDELAQELYTNAAAQFELAYEQAAEKRDQAQRALENVDRRIQDLDTQRQTLETEAGEELAEPDTDDESDEGGM